MKYEFLLLAFMGLLSCTSQPGQTISVSDSTPSATATESKPVKKDSYFALLKGTIDTYPVTMYLFALDHIYSGYYYYDSKQQPIYFNGEDSSVKNKIVLTASVNNDTTEIFTFSFDGNKATGSWKLGSKTLPLLLAKASMPISFDYVVWKDSALLSGKLPDSPQATAELSSVWPTGSSAKDELIKREVAKLFGDKPGSDDIKTILSKNGKSFFDDYRSDTSVTEEDIKQSPQTYSYDLSGDLRISYQSVTLLSLSLLSYSYTGGAHGNYGTSYLPLDLQNNKVLTLADMLTAAGIRQLRPLLEKNYRRDIGLQPSQPLTEAAGLFENKIEPNENFYVTGKGLIFCYNPYEIASYADGEIEIMIPYSDLQVYLQPSFKRLLQ